MALPTTKRKPKSLVKPQKEAPEKREINAISREKMRRKERKMLMATMRKQREREKKKFQ